MDLNEIDIWTTEMFYEYYQKLMPFYESWYNIENGYRSVAIGRNLAWWLEKEEIERECYIKKYKNDKQCKNKNETCKLLLKQFGTDKLSCWECSIKTEKKKRALISPWERFYNVFEKILWDIDHVKNTNVLKTCRTLYWHNSIRNIKLKDIKTDKSWNEIIGSNFTLDIDIENKHTENMFDKWEYLPSMINDVASKLENDDIEYKILSSGNGIYFITKRIFYEIEKENNETCEVFWNKISNGWRKYINDDLNPIFEKHPKFNVDGEEPYTMKFYKSPFSIHQRLDLSAIPLSVDMINSINGKDFKELSEPLYVSNNWKNLLKIWK